MEATGGERNDEGEAQRDWIHTHFHARAGRKVWEGRATNGD